MIESVVIPVAGLGTRNLPATKSIPKEMLPVLDKPAIHYIIEEARESGIKKALLVSGRHKKAIEDYFDSFPELEHILKQKGKEKALKSILEPLSIMKIFITRQAEAKGLGHAVYQAKEFINEPAFAVMLPDDLAISDTPYLKQLIDAYNRFHTSVIAVEYVPKNDVSSYGIIEAAEVEEGIYEVKGLVEKPQPADAPSNLGIIGRYVLTKEIFEELENIKPGAGGELQLTDAMRGLIKRQKMYAVVCKGKRFDIGNISGLIKTNIAYALHSEDYRAEILDYIKEFINEA